MGRICALDAMVVVADGAAQADALLTAQGEQEARIANAAWKTQIAAGAPVPGSFYTSPMRRSASTLQITWNDITLDTKDALPEPVIKEVGSRIFAQPLHC